ncbi:Metal-dependent hydrolase, endonuclease/exonuclease/phosphatase family [Roseivivax lentus]|uniref:Metal-dependent hydrolase, endonuclease/exonuclease/phosphatase family n=1 Tax=Roseivivax lentus TaxID=633194 RepID=A0A1N7NPV1_9RHOB|nr:endonuclease/exonuclease/phosphatase family protein [Roseivivax lentus]SIT00423.1 Metal-dependent hydrolase, endonuclease/exonuclease/phosphatase family [Roseivivax lentus]
MTELTLASYNIRKAVGLDWKRDPARILSVLTEIDADIVVLQEADKRLGARPSAIPHFLIEQETDYVPADLARNKVSLGWHGNAILVRRGLRVEDTRHFTLPGLEPRGAVMARIEGLSVVGTHLGLLRSWRRRQMQQIRQHLGEAASGALIAGDFNEWSDTTGYEPWARDFTLVTPGPSFHAARPVAALDGIAHGARVAVTEAGVHRGSHARVASDHLPIWVRLKLKTED